MVVCSVTVGTGLLDVILSLVLAVLADLVELVSVLEALGTLCVRLLVANAWLEVVSVSWSGALAELPQRAFGPLPARNCVRIGKSLRSALSQAS